MTTTTDSVGNEIYAAHYHERRLSRLALIVLGIVTALQTAVIINLATRPVVNRYVRIDEMGRATAIAYNDLDYSPREGEIRTFLTDWANFRYTMVPATVANPTRAVTTF